MRLQSAMPVARQPVTQQPAAPQNVAVQAPAGQLRQWLRQPAFVITFGLAAFLIGVPLLCIVVSVLSSGPAGYRVRGEVITSAAASPGAGNVSSHSAPVAEGDGQPAAETSSPPQLTPVPIALVAGPPLTEAQTVLEGDVPWSIGSVAVYQDALDIRIYGVLRNDGAQPRGNVRLRVTLRDQTGVELVSEEDYPTIDYARPGDYIGFRIFLDDENGQLPVEGAYTIDYDILSEVAVESNARRRDLPVSNTVFARNSPYTFTWSTTITNLDQPVQYPAAQAIFFSDAGQVVGEGVAYPDEFRGPIAPGGTLQLQGAYTFLEKQPSSMVVLTTADPVGP
jgi:hypothetical protein